MTYKIIFEEKGETKEIQDFSFKRRDQAERYYFKWCADRNLKLIRIQNVRENKKTEEKKQ